MCLHIYIYICIYAAAVVAAASSGSSPLSGMSRTRLEMTWAVAGRPHTKCKYIHQCGYDHNHEHPCRSSDMYILVLIINWPQASHFDFTNIGYPVPPK